jgi:phosphopantothenoylcysteine decarboxylase/phosphopantothenate--cysteine ligase
MRKALKGKRVLITAGPTWVAIDRVRVISNISSGLTGITIARCAAKMGADVTLLLGPCPAYHSEPRRGEESLDPSAFGLKMTKSDSFLKIIRFKYFDELQKLVKSQLSRKKYDILIHTAAVSDYRPVKTDQEKIKSGKKKLVIELRPTVKIIDQMRRQATGAFLVMFKLEAGKPRNRLIEIAYKSMHRVKADMIVANSINEISKSKHKAYIIDIDRRITTVETKGELARKLLTKIL